MAFHQRFATITSSAAMMWMVLVCTSFSAQAQRTDSATMRNRRLGVFVGGMYSMHAADFTKMSDSGFCCPRTFGKVPATGFNAGLLAEYSFNPEFSVSGRLSLWVQSPVFSQTETTVFNNPDNNEQVSGAFAYTVQPSLTSIALDVLGQFRMTESISLYAGPRLNMMARASFDQREEVVTPGYVFVDNLKRTRNEIVDAAIPGMSVIHAGLAAGISYEIPLNPRRTVMLTPELFGTIGLGSMSDGVRGGSGSWRMSSVLFNLALKFAPVGREQTQEVRIITAPCDDCKERRTPDSECEPVMNCPENRILRKNPGTGECECAVLQDIVRFEKITGTRAGKEIRLGVEKGDTSLIVEGFGRKRYKPLLPYIFFKESSDEFAVSYSQVSSMRVAKEELDKAKAMENLSEALYKNVINVIGMRMNANPSSILRLRATTDGLETDSARNLLLRRVNAVRSRLARIFDIDGSRLQVDSNRRTLPEKKAMVNGRSDHPLARAENRRVEFYSDDQSLLAPVEIEDEIIAVSPPYLDYAMKVVTVSEATQAVVQLKGVRRSGGDITYLANETADLDAQSPESVTIRFDTRKWESDARIRELTSIMVDDRKSQVRTAAGQPLSFINSKKYVIPVRYIPPSEKQALSMQDTVYREFELNLFDFDSDKLGPMNEYIVNMAKKEITASSMVTVTGNTDDSGTREINMSLSQRRAQSVAALLQGLTANITVVGKADTEPLKGINNETAYGRNMNRNVVIRIITPR